MRSPALCALTVLLLALAGCTEPKEGARKRDSSTGAEEEATGGTGGPDEEPPAGGTGGRPRGTGGAIGGSAGSGGQGGGGAQAGGGGQTGGGADAGHDGPAPQCTSNAGCGTCQECVGGKCQNQGAGQDLKEECDGSNAMACLTGSCDGNGACQRRTGSTCDGAGLVVCSAAGTGTRQSCPSGMCAGSQCVACGGANQPCCGSSCDSGYMCSAGTCKTTCVPGGPCGTNNMCRSGKISCDTGAPVCVTMAINEGIVCSSRKCSGTTTVVEGRCGGGNCVEQTVQSCSSTQSCTSGQCKKKNGQPCSSNSECANNSCKGPRFCYFGSNGHCPCLADADCESTDCRMNDSMKTCGGGDCPPGWSCNGTPPEEDTCNVFN